MNAGNTNASQPDIGAEIERKRAELAADRVIAPGGWSCPQRAASFGLAAYPLTDTWRANGTCSYCGSLSPAALFAAIEAGSELVPTDKNYKAYIKLPNPEAGQEVEVGRRSGPTMDRDTGALNIDNPTFEEVSSGHYSRAIFGIAPPVIHAKFYFQHFDDADCARFVDMLNAGTINLAYPARFYVLPFFMCIREPAKAPRG